MEVDPKLGAALTALREKIAGLAASEDDNKWICSAPDDICLKFLVGHNLNVKTAFNLMQQCSKWRFEKKVDTLYERYSADSSISTRFAKAYFPATILGRDPEGRPICLNQMGVVDYPKIMQEFGIEKVIEYSIYTCEEAMRDNPLKQNIIVLNLGQEGHPNPPFTSIFEVGGWVSALLSYVQALSGVVDPYYPETTYKMIFLNAPSMFWASWKVAQTFLHERTRQKVEVYSSAESSNKRMQELLPDSLIPYNLGGSNNLQGVGKGGRLPKDACNDLVFVENLEKELQNGLKDVNAK